MMTRTRNGSLAATLALLLTATVTSMSAANSLDMAQDEELAYNIGVQAYLYSFPTMDLYRTLYETSLDPERRSQATINEFDHRRTLSTHETTFVVTPNEDTLYSFAFVDLRAEPIILVIPPMGDRQYWFPVGEMYHDFAANLSWDTVGSSGGSYALGAPGWEGLLPDGVERVDVMTPIVWIGGRYAVNGRDDVPNAARLQDKTHLIPLSQWGATTMKRPSIDASDYPVLTRHDLTDPEKYWTVLNEVLRMTPRSGNQVDAAMLAWMREVGVHPHQQFNMSQLSPETRRGLERAVAEAHAIIARRLPRVVPSINNWQIFRIDKDTSDNFMFSAGGAMLGLLYNPLEVSTYDLTFFDGDGAQLDGKNDYVIHLDPPPPVDAFWSLTMYSAKTQLFVESEINRYSIGDRTPGLVYGEDGSLTVHISHERPGDPDAQANWLPAPDEPFYVLLRHYSPQAPILNGDWVPPAIEQHTR